MGGRVLAEAAKVSHNRERNMPGKLVMAICAVLIFVCTCAVLFGSSHVYKPEWNRRQAASTHCDVTQSQTSVRCGADLWFKSEVQIDGDKTVDQYPPRTHLVCSSAGGRHIKCRSKDKESPRISRALYFYRTSNPFAFTPA